MHDRWWLLRAGRNNFKLRQYVPIFAMLQLRKQCKRSNYKFLTAERNEIRDQEMSLFTMFTSIVVDNGTSKLHVFRLNITVLTVPQETLTF